MSAGTYNISIEQGVDFVNAISIIGNTGAPMDVTGANFKSQIRRNYSAPDVIADFAVVVAGDPTQGNIQIQLPASTSNTIPLDASTDYRLKTTKFAYDLIMTMPDGSTIRLLQGTVEISPRVSK